MCLMMASKSGSIVPLTCFEFDLGVTVFGAEQ